MQGSDFSQAFCGGCSCPVFICGWWRWTTTRFVLRLASQWRVATMWSLLLCLWTLFYYQLLSNPYCLINEYTSDIIIFTACIQGSVLGSDINKHFKSCTIIKPQLGLSRYHCSSSGYYAILPDAAFSFFTCVHFLASTVHICTHLHKLL